MYRYDELKRLHGARVSQTIDSPIMIFDFWELSDAFSALMIILTFGVVFYSWGAMAMLLFLVLGIMPVVRKRNLPGIFFHWPYRNLRISLPGILNPKGSRKFSD